MNSQKTFSAKEKKISVNAAESSLAHQRNRNQGLTRLLHRYVQLSEWRATAYVDRTGRRARRVSLAILPNGRPAIHVQPTATRAARRVRHVSDRWLVLAGGEGGPGHPHAELRIAFIHPDRGASVTGLSLMSAPASLLRIFSFEFGSIWQLAIAGDLGFNCLGGVNCFAFERITPRRPEIRAKCYC